MTHHSISLMTSLPVICVSEKSITARKSASTNQKLNLENHRQLKIFLLSEINFKCILIDLRSFAILRKKIPSVGPWRTFWTKNFVDGLFGKFVRLVICSGAVCFSLARKIFSILFSINQNGRARFIDQSKSSISHYSHYDSRISKGTLLSISEKKWTKMENAENQWRLDLQSVLNETNQLTISASGTNLNLQLIQVQRK